jgi:hypothetical protein
MKSRESVTACRRKIRDERAGTLHCCGALSNHAGLKGRGTNLRFRLSRPGDLHVFAREGDHWRSFRSIGCRTIVPRRGGRVAPLSRDAVGLTLRKRWRALSQMSMKRGTHPRCERRGPFHRAGREPRQPDKATSRGRRSGVVKLEPEPHVTVQQHQTYSNTFQRLGRDVRKDRSACRSGGPSFDVKVERGSRLKGRRPSPASNQPPRRDDDAIHGTHQK